MNTNEYVIDAKRFIQQIKRCRCKSTIDGNYNVECKIRQRGEHEYTYLKERGFIQRINSLKGFYLSDEASATVEDAIAEYDKAAETAKTTYVRTDVPELDLTFYYQYDNGVLNLYQEYRLDGHEHTTINIGESLADVLWWHVYPHHLLDNRDTYDALFRSTADTLKDNPFYVSAVNTGNEQFELALKLYYRVADASECKKLEEQTGKRILPSLSEEFDKGYYVKPTDELIKLIINSGYKISHKPNMTMMGFTRLAISLNPHTKTGVDAARSGEPVIEADEFLEMFKDK